MTTERRVVVLSAEWRWLAMLNYTVDPALLANLVPSGVELDTYEGRAFVSLIGFRFRRTRVLGIPIPFHQDFEEVNLRFYTRRDLGGETRHGVTFIRETVPRHAVSTMAWLTYNEPYVTLPMRSSVPPFDSADPERARFEWGHAGRARHLEIRVGGSGARPPEGSEARFLAERHWGYTRQRDGSTFEYQVLHPPWRVWHGESSVGGDMESLYGPAFGRVLAGKPASAFLADGSAVTISRPAVVPR
jgi:uncharacterized protein